MASELPAPLTPANADLRSFAYLPLDVVRLRDSDMAAVEDAEAFRAAVLLWCASWHQVPTASLPDDDAALCRLSGYGRDIKTWRKARASGALRGWIICTDGRLYHPVIAEKANDALLAKQVQRQKTEAARAAREAKRQQPLSEPHAETTTEDVTTSVSDKTTEAVTISVTEVVTEPPQSLSQSPREGKGREVKRSKQDASAMPSLADPPERWLELADKREVDVEGVERAVVGGCYLDAAARNVCNAAKMRTLDRPMDWTSLVGWLRDGIDVDGHIVPLIRQIATRPTYIPPHSLAYFDSVVRQGVAA